MRKNVDPEAARARAKKLGSDPAVEAWIRRFRKLCNDMPKSIHVFVASGTPTVMAARPDGQIYESGNGGQERAAIIESVGSAGGWDGGDW